MSATCLDVVTSALRLARVINLSKQPKDPEAEAGLECLQSLYDEWVANGMFGRLEDVYLDADDTAQEGKRYFLTAGTILTGLSDEYTPEGETESRQVRDLAIYEVLYDGGETREVTLYDRTGWVSLTDLGLSDIAPLSGRGKMGLAACLATSGMFASMFGNGQGVNPDVLMGAQRFKQALSMKLGSTRDRATSEYF